MSIHIDEKKLVKRYMTDKEDIRTIAERCALKDDDKKILYMVLAECRDERYVADMLGYSYSQIKRRFSAALPIFISVARKYNYIP